MEYNKLKLSPDNIMERLLKINPGRNPEFTAFEELKTPAEIGAFILAYERLVNENPPEEVVSGKYTPLQVIENDMNYIPGYYYDCNEKGRELRNEAMQPWHAAFRALKKMRKTEV